MRELGRRNRVSFSKHSSKGVPKIPKSKSEPDPKLDNVIKNPVMNRRKSNEQASQPESTKMKRSINGGSNLELDLNSSRGTKPKAQFQDFVSHGDIQNNLRKADHSFGQLDTKSPCSSSSDAENFEENLSVSHTPPETSLSSKGSFLINASEDRQILEVLYNVKNSKNIRKQEKLRDQLSNIQHRVKMALENFGLVKEEEEASSKKLPPISNNISTEQQKKNERNNILLSVEAYISRSVIQQDLLLELELWHKNKENLSEDFGLLSNKDLTDNINSCQELHISILKDIEIMSDTGERIITLGQQLLDEMRKVKTNVFHPDRQRDPFKKINREKIVVYNESALLENPTKRNAAVKMVLEQIDESIANMKSKVLKNSLGAARKQYQYLMNVADQQNNELMEKGRQYIELKDNIVKVESQCKELRKQLEETQYFNAKDGTGNLLLQNEMQNERNREWKAKVAELQIMNNNQETMIKMQDRKALQASKTLPTSVESDVDPQQSFPQSVLSALQIPELAYSETLLQLLIPDEELTIHKNEANDYQKLITRKIFTSELDKVKMDVLREKMRHEDEMQTDHIEQMGILKESIHGVLCALVNFKDQLTQVLRKENLQDVAEKFDKLENLAEKLSPGSTDAFGLVVSNVIDYLHSLQEIISYGFEAYKHLFQTFQSSTPLPVKIKPYQEKTNFIIQDTTNQKDVIHHACPGIQKMKIIKDTQQKCLGEIPDDVSKHDHLTVVELDQNLALIVKAYEENRISKSLYKKAVTAIQRVKRMPLLKLKTLMEWYIEVKKMEQLRESYITLIEDENGSDNIVVDLENYIQICQKKKQLKILEIQEKWKKIEQEKKELNARLLKIFNKLYAETGILLIYPMLWDTSMQNKILYKSLPSIEQKTLRNMLCNRGRTKNDIFKLPEIVTGVAMPIRSLTGPQTGTITKQVSKPDNPGEPFLPAVIMTPHLVNYQINKPHMHAIRYWKKPGCRVHQPVSVFKRDSVAFNPNA
ncbi:hypothetical protein CHS0354_037489 [Potamilus streckersoni]|uniref:Uncharacterized protein n=1 Tax=Potamilus streckersoni TaxID=2493646 RepID=A0AAE0VG65_9BIVA|nr:hypothetical protein CHS0354_037489 [Potamilus streckersoni]